MCWGIEATGAMLALGAGAAVVTSRRGDPRGIPLALGYFALMEGLQLAGYLVIDQCGTPGNRTVTQLSMLHIALQPVVINAFMLALVSGGVAPRVRWRVMGLAAAASAIILAQLLPLPALGSCAPGYALCGPDWCTRSGEWHLAWDVPYNGLLVPLDRALGTGMAFPSYLLAVFVLPLTYGAWRFALLHLAIGPVLAFALTADRGEAPALWCLASVLILLAGLSPAFRRVVAVQGARA